MTVKGDQKAQGKQRNSLEAKPIKMAHGRKKKKKNEDTKKKKTTNKKKKEKSLVISCQNINYKPDTTMKTKIYRLETQTD